MQKSLLKTSFLIDDNLLVYSLIYYHVVRVSVNDDVIINKKEDLLIPPESPLSSENENENKEVLLQNAARKVIIFGMICEIVSVQRCFIRLTFQQRLFLP